MAGGTPAVGVEQVDDGGDERRARRGVLAEVACQEVREPNAAESLHRSFEHRPGWARAQARHVRLCVVRTLAGEEKKAPLLAATAKTRDHLLRRVRPAAEARRRAMQGGGVLRGLSLRLLCRRVAAGRAASSYFPEVGGLRRIQHLRRAVAHLLHLLLACRHESRAQPSQRALQMETGTPQAAASRQTCSNTTFFRRSREAARHDSSADWQRGCGGERTRHRLHNRCAASLRARRLRRIGAHAVWPPDAVQRRGSAGPTPSSF